MNADNWSSASAAAFNLFSTAFTLTSDLCLPGLTIASLSSSVKSWIMLRMRRSVPLWVSSENASLYCYCKGKGKVRIYEIMWIICEGSVIIPLEYDIRCRFRVSMRGTAWERIVIQNWGCRTLLSASLIFAGTSSFLRRCESSVWWSLA